MRRKRSTEPADHLKFLREAREETWEQLQNFRKFRRIMQRIVNDIPRERGTFGSDPLEEDLLRGTSPRELACLLSEDETERNLKKLLASIDREIAALLAQPDTPAA